MIRKHSFEPMESLRSICKKCGLRKDDEAHELDTQTTLG